MSMGKWRSKARAVILLALREGANHGLEGDELARFVNEAYPFGLKENFPYKVWRQEFRRHVLGIKKSPRATRLDNTVYAGEWPGLTARQRAVLGIPAKPEGGL
jgi:hypothetical protein